MNHQLALRLADLLGYEVAANRDATARYPGPKYFVPNDTLVGLDAAKDVGICSEHDLFGGVVPYAFAATKVITHPVVKPGACAPPECSLVRALVNWPGALRPRGGCTRVLHGHTGRV